MTPDTASNLQEMSHADFANGMRAGTLACWLAEPYQLQSGLRKFLFNFFMLLYIAGPLILISMWAYHVHDWVFLIGIAFCYVATQSASEFNRIVFLFA